MTEFQKYGSRFVREGGATGAEGHSHARGSPTIAYSNIAFGGSRTHSVYHYLQFCCPVRPFAMRPLVLVALLPLVASIGENPVESSVLRKLPDRHPNPDGHHRRHREHAPEQC